MKGTLHKTEQGWMVRYDQRTWQDPSAEDGELPLLPDDLWVIDHTGCALGLKQEIEFEAITEDIVHPIDKHIIKFTYAKLIHHHVDTNKMISKGGELATFKDQVPDVRKMAEEYGATCNQLYKEWLKIGFEEGYNKAKETLYTKEDVLKAGEIGEINHYDYKHIVSLLDEAKAINQSLKKPKQNGTI